MSTIEHFDRPESEKMVEEMRERAIGYFKSPDPDGMGTATITEFASLNDGTCKKNGVVRIIKGSFRYRVLMRKWDKEKPEEGFAEVLLNFFILPETEKRKITLKDDLITLIGVENYPDSKTLAPGRSYNLKFIKPEYANNFYDELIKGRNANTEELKKKGLLK